MDQKQLYQNVLLKMKHSLYLHRRNLYDPLFMYTALGRRLYNDYYRIATEKEIAIVEDKLAKL